MKVANHDQMTYFNTFGTAPFFQNLDVNNLFPAFGCTKNTMQPKSKFFYSLDNKMLSSYNRYHDSVLCLYYSQLISLSYNKNLSFIYFIVFTFRNLNTNFFSILELFSILTRYNKNTTVKIHK